MTKQKFDSSCGYRKTIGLVQNGDLLYTIRPIQEAVDYKLERDWAALHEPKHPRKNSENQTRLCVALCAVLKAE